MSFIRVIKPGLLTTIQDRGRFGYQQWGIPVAGAMDEYALRIANLLVGNPEGEACLEITLLGPTLEFQAEGVIALTGADLGARLNGQDLPLWQALQVQKGDKLEFTGVKAGCRVYLAVAGGFEVPVVMGSKSTYVRGQIGGFAGRSLRKGDEIGIRVPRVDLRRLINRTVPREYRYEFTNPILVRVVLGPQDDAFTEDGIRTFLEGQYQVTNEADRMGYRLDGPKIQHKTSPDIISDGIVMGSIQVPGHGLPIIMMADRQTTGGYTKIATVITADLNKIAQAKPGDAIRFQAVSIEEAHEIYRAYEEKIRNVKDKFIFAQKEPFTSKKGLKRTMRIWVNGTEYIVEIERL
ncbi:biotin-dependent carboxylase uncharacterized domain-containing protein [Carboxydocella sporoproducens DSM 16521]|uniref:Biotin-dependent carboxylase uncharacterized domain-containing protein n=2 Tax=Carboxydocella TaxID=178898 RepID=A0A1T4R2R7_9FIRM|nr:MULTISPECIES: biotin-dependent carboxyltransferase family protein [Carboxydocella]AVX21753.1 biotin-dependent carboxylase uncharacterized domain-containing protein [Carboxydocella thermautotrophica]SKA10145.1 biotin-dependent carboxylase uncharacterized domain-containing protein [Carboxydocella sporoproducens DSM 16521]